MEKWQKQLEILKRGAVDILSESELIEKLKLNRPLRIKLGVDPTAPDIHLGHTVVLRKLRQFQDLGHQAVLIIGDFTALIGDPSGRVKTRPQLTADEIEINAETYMKQVGKILKAEKLELRRNSEWLGKLQMKDILQLTSQVTVARFIERDDFSKRLRERAPIGLHELLYPMMQGYDSVAVKADVELGGTDQTFNLLVGRDLQRAEGIAPQIALTTPLLVGLDGVNKMSKTLDNYIGVTEPSFDMFGKTMSIPDSLMKDYYVLLTGIEMAEIESILKQHPRDAKMRLGREIVTNYHTAAEAQEAADKFIRVFSRKEMPNDIPEIQLGPGDMKSGKIWLPKLLTKCKMAESTSAATRLISQGAVLIDNEKVIDPESEVVVKNGMILKVGKKNRFCRIKV
ncbi:MAG: tyrosine--tRNA ligase [Planctomycetes bacterium]|nr:tyrosine--tRNA ligase [Planctomycetota bacterium]